MATPSWSAPSSYSRNVGVRACARALLCCLCCLGPAAAQSLEDFIQDSTLGLSLSSRTQGSSNRSGVVTKLDTVAAYNFSQYFGVDLGAPIYFVRPSGKTASQLGGRPRNGLGNVYLNLRFTLSKPAVNFVSFVTVAAPTGDRAEGFSTGHVTCDWHNHFYRTFGRVTPFANAGLGDTITDSPFYLRPFSSLGLLGHFEGGSTIRLWRQLSAGTSFYAIVPSGDQHVISKLSGKQTPVKGSSLGRIFEIPDLTEPGPISIRDQGFSLWVEAVVTPFLDFDIGYSRSTQYALNSMFFGVGFNWKSLIHR